MTSPARLLPLLLLPVLLPVLLSGCTTGAASAPAQTVTVTATPSAAPLKAGDSAPWDLHAVCAAESEAETLILWRKQQAQAHRLTPGQSASVLQAIAVQYLEFAQSGLPASVQQDVAALASAAGTLEHPSIDLRSRPVLVAKNDLHQVCQRSGLTIGVLAQGG